jgi:26S proteasome regulatory subunit N13
MSLFGGAVASQARSRNLVEFKAGKMNLRGSTVYPDKRKGLVYLYQGNDMLMHLCWKDRSNNSPEDDLVIFPDEIEFKKVTQNTTGRVYVLKWRTNARKYFFWMQEPKDDKDEEFCKKINNLLNHPPAPGFDDDDGAGSGNPLQPFMERMAGGGASGLDSNDLSNVLRGMGPNELASLLNSIGRSGGGAASLMQGLHRGRGSSNSTNQHGSTSSPSSASAQPTTDNRSNVTRTAGATSTTRSSGSSTKSRSGGTSSSSSAAAVPKTTTGSTASSGSKTSSIQMSALTSVLASLGNNTTPEDSSKPATDLYDLIDSETLIPLLSNKDVQEKLRVYLPEGNLIFSTEKELRDSIQSPQFRQIVNAFSTALQSGELGPILIQSGFPDDVTKAASQGDLHAFAKAIEKHSKSSNDDPMDINE